MLKFFHHVYFGTQYRQGIQLLIIGKSTEIRIYFTFSDLFSTKRNSAWFKINRKMCPVDGIFSDWFLTKRNSAWFKINRKMVNTIWFRWIRQESEGNFSVAGKSKKKSLWQLQLMAIKSSSAHTSEQAN